MHSNHLAAFAASSVHGRGESRVNWNPKVSDAVNQRASGTGRRKRGEKAVCLNFGNVIFTSSAKRKAESPRVAGRTCIRRQAVFID